jgi:hypothetical protein
VTESTDEIKAESKPGTIPHVVFYSLAVSFILALRYAPLFAGGAVFGSEIHLRYLRPTVEFFRDQIQVHGTVPAWNPFCYLGMPLLPGCFPGSYYPLNIILLIENYDIACALFLLLHQIIGFTGIYLALSQVRAKSVVRLLISLLYCGGALVLVSDSNLALAATLAWFPFCLFGTARCVVQREQKPHKAGLIVINSIFIALMLVSGSLVFAFGAVLFFLLTLLACRLRSLDARFGMYGLAILISVCIAAPVILPVFDWMQDDTASGAVRNLLRSCPRFADGGIFALPQTMTKADLYTLARKRDEMLKSIQGTVGHHGRYLVASRESSVDSAVVRSILPDMNMKTQLGSPFGYLGHPVASYRMFVKGAIGFEPDESISFSAGDALLGERLLKFSTFSSTGMLFTSNEDAFRQAEVVLTDWRPFMLPMRDEPKSWRCFMQGVVVPVAYSIDAWHWVKNRDEIVQQYFEGGRWFDPRFQLLVEKPLSIEVDEERLDVLPFSQVNPPGGPPVSDSRGAELSRNETRCKSVDVMAYEPEHISLSVNVKSPSFVVVRDTYYPGWKAYVDSTPAPMYRANGFARAVFVSEGSHLVTFDYRPASQKLGFNLALTALLINAFLSFFWLSRLLGKTIHFLSVGKFE